MPRVLIIGATGYIGLAVGQALVRTGRYTVWGTARSAEKAKLLALNEIKPVESLSLVERGQLSSFIATEVMDIIVDASTAWDLTSTILQEVIRAGKIRATNLSNVGAVGPKLGYILTSGTWVYGEPLKRVSDLSPVGNSLAEAEPPVFFEARPAQEQAALAARDELNIAILRPGNLYGRACPDWGLFWHHFKSFKESSNVEQITMPVKHDAVSAVVHVDDVASAFVSTIDRLDGRLGNWPVFDIVTEHLRLPDIIEASKLAFGINSTILYVTPSGDQLLEAMNLVDNSGGSARAQAVLNWSPRHVHFLRDMPIYVHAWRAANE
jgi:nucleoside-diphosphate-sugar epimerase